MKIALLDAHNEAYDDLAKITLASKKAYCKKNNIDCLCYKFGKLDRTPHWGRILALQHHLPSYDWILYLDTDCVILNYKINIKDYIDDKYNIILGRMKNQISTSGLLVKNSQWTLDFLKQWWEQRYFIDKPYIANKEHKNLATMGDDGMLVYEQSAMHYLYDTNEQIRSKIKVVPRHWFNSRDCNTFYYETGHFLVHFPGLNYFEKVNKAKIYSIKHI